MDNNARLIVEWQGVERMPTFSDTWVEKVVDEETRDAAERSDRG